MIIDSSAIVALLMQEPLAVPIARAIGGAEECRIGAPTLVETSIVLANKEGERGTTLLASFLQRRRFDVFTFGEAHWRTAQTAFLRYGKGRHSAALNFGDCLTYAAAMVAREPLLCIGDDFPQTDLELVKLEEN
ncbi:type II toxin-antitoxin system VapC family toxin [Amycolatopsis circi]|uniref:type II toxin-antitoxin system VapC family toxin n=1 Tax=Amycolatopsis circi TaxID=871959 RepID=UPI000E286126|nr:type II toxin-antitoxin system VapC family toxin [Amycolatopsis circi]